MPDPEPTPAEEQVRRLLADARHTEPLPDDVAARLDGVLADLRDEPDPRRAPAVSDLATARRRRNARTWLVAAAAAVAIGIGINQLDLSGSSQDDSGAASSADQAEAGGSADFSAKPPAASSPAPDDAPMDSAGSGALSADGLFSLRPLLRLDPDRFGAEVRRLRGSGVNGLTESQTPAGRNMHLTKSCTVPDGPGRLVAVRYDGERGVLVYRPVEGDTQVVDLFLCGSDDPTRSITLPAP
ncbi:hypothetical protein ABLE68_08505 [Nocardioides sp. CN2-186]|uniref:hypothetical protein n=1 Tax=Nocardioides tweenelious TaxID=3156607 RepID=UPI0032B331F4